MASNADFVQYIADQYAEAGEIVTRKMFGDYGIYCNGKIIGLICHDSIAPDVETGTPLEDEVNWIMMN